MAIFDPSQECYISVDVETSGPAPSRYSMLSIGACVVTEPEQRFYIELQPVNDEAVPQALEITGLSMERLADEGAPPAEAMQYFASWLSRVAGPGRKPIFVAFNAPFDWMFVSDYFHRFLGANPFGHSAVDIKALTMGLARVPRQETSMTALEHRYSQMQQLTHHALEDALQQAELLRLILAEFDEALTGGKNGDQSDTLPEGGFAAGC